MMMKIWSATSAAITLGLAVTVGAALTPPLEPAKRITVTGCVQKQTDVLTRNAMAGKIGMSDEWVLTRAALNPQPIAETTPAQPNRAPREPTGTTAQTPIFGKVYRMTADKEQDLKPYAGQRVAIIGAFKHETDARRELSPVGTAGKMPDPAVQLAPANTPEITIESIKPIAGVCGTAMKIP